MSELVKCIQSGGSAGVADGLRSGGGGWGGAEGNISALHSPTEGRGGPTGRGSGAGVSGCGPGLNMPGAVNPQGGVGVAQWGALCGGAPGGAGCSRAEGGTAGGGSEGGGGGGGAPGSPDAGEARASGPVPGLQYGGCMPSGCRGPMWDRPVGLVRVRGGRWVMGRSHGEAWWCRRRWWRAACAWRWGRAVVPAFADAVDLASIASR